MGNYSFLVLCNPSETTTGLAGGTEAAAAVAVGTERAAPLGWPGRSSGSALKPGQFSAQHSSEHEMRSGCSAEDTVARVGGRGCSPSSCGQCWGQQQLYWVTFISLCVSSGAWGTHGSRASLSSLVPRPMHWPATLDFSWHCQHKPCFQKKPNKVKETPCS